MIVCGFAYKKTDNGIKIFDLNNGEGAAVGCTFSMNVESWARGFEKNESYCVESIRVEY